MICKNCGVEIHLAGEGIYSGGNPFDVEPRKVWADFTEGKWLVCDPYWQQKRIEKVYHEPLILSDEETIAGLRLIVEDLR